LLSGRALSSATWAASFLACMADAVLLSPDSCGAAAVVVQERVERCGRQLTQLGCSADVRC
jgi:hypothetical protein